jgi:hypothetical protein
LKTASEIIINNGDKFMVLQGVLTFFIRFSICFMIIVPFVTAILFCIFVLKAGNITILLAAITSLIVSIALAVLFALVIRYSAETIMHCVIIDVALHNEPMFAPNNIASELMS